MGNRRISASEFKRFAPTLKDKIRKARRVHAWKPGEGWKVLLEYPFEVDLPNGGHFMTETSEGCILHALSAVLGKERLRRLFRKAYPDEPANWLDGIEEYAGLIDGQVTRRHLERLLEDLTDVNYHSLRNAVEEDLREDGDTP